MKKTSLWIFSQKISRLGKIWFEELTDDGELDELAEFITDSGVYGTSHHTKLSLALKGQKAKQPTLLLKTFYIIRLCFPALNDMYTLYPSLRKFPVLLPVCWIHRGITRVLFRPKVVLQLLSSAFKLPSRQLKKRAEFFNHLDLYK